MTWTARILELFLADRGRLPRDLEEVFAEKLPTGRGNDPTTDLFGHALEYEPGEDGRSFALKSLGKDGEPGGRGPAADVEVRRP